MLITLLNFTSLEIIKAAEPNEKTNYQFISTNDFNNIQYTYEEGGKTYRVYECVNEDFTEIHTMQYAVFVIL